MSTLTPPLAVFDRTLARAVAKAYRSAYATNDMGLPHQAGWQRAQAVFWKMHPGSNSDAVASTVRTILAAIEAEYPGWLTAGADRRDPETNHDAYMEMSTLGKVWPGKPRAG